MSEQTINESLSKRYGLTVLNTLSRDTYFVVELKETMTKKEIRKWNRTFPVLHRLSRKYGMDIRRSKNPKFKYLLTNENLCYTKQEIIEIAKWRDFQVVYEPKRLDIIARYTALNAQEDFDTNEVLELANDTMELLDDLARQYKEEPKAITEIFYDWEEAWDYDKYGIKTVLDKAVKLL